MTMFKMIVNLAFVATLGLFGWGVYNNQHVNGNGLQPAMVTR